MMEIERIIVHKRKPMPNKMHLGFEGDNMVRRIAFDLPEVSDAQTATLMYGGKYADMISLVKDGDQWVADLTAEMVGAAGEVEGYVRVDGADGEVWHSDILRIVTGDVPAVEVQIEKLYPTAVDQMLTAMAEHKTEMDAAVERAEAAADRAESAGGGGGSGGSGGITQETDPTVPAWAKQPEKPTYTADEVGALAADAPVVRYAAQELTEEQQAQARENVGAQPAGDYALKTDIPEPYVLPTASATVKGGVMVGKGLEMDGEALEVVPEGEYELIKTITLTAETTGVAEIIERFSPGFDGLIVTLTGAAEDRARTIYVGVGLNWTLRSVGYALTAKDVARFVFRKISGIWDIYGYAGSSSGPSNMLGQVSANRLSNAGNTSDGMDNSFATIGFLRVYTFDSTGLVDGTTINIYGKRDSR